MVNLLFETIQFLQKYEKKLDDILYVTDGCNFRRVNKKILQSLLNENYDSGYGCVEINRELKLVGKDFWLERWEYDGSEGWSFKQYPKYVETNFKTIMVRE